jgi:hypothetical protein
MMLYSVKLCFGAGARADQNFNCVERYSLILLALLPNRPTEAAIYVQLVGVEAYKNLPV